MERVDCFDYSKLRGRIVEKYRSLGSFAEVMGWSLQTQQKKLSGRVAWTQDDMARAICLLGLVPTDIPTYFFTEKVKNMTKEV